MDVDKTAQRMAATITGASILSLIAWFVVGFVAIMRVLL